MANNQQLQHTPTMRETMDIVHEWVDGGMKDDARPLQVVSVDESAKAGHLRVTIDFPKAK